MLDPGAYDAPYLIDVAHPDIEAMGVDISKSVRLSHEVAEYFDLYVQIKQCRSFLAALPSHHRQPQEMIRYSSEFRAKQVPFKLGELVQHGVRVGIQLFKLGQQIQMDITHADIFPSSASILLSQ